MKLKKVLSTALAGVMALSMSVPALAAGNTQTSNDVNMTTVITGSYQKSTIDVVVPSATTAFLNPYGIGIKATGENTEVMIPGQIVSTPNYIQNKSAFDLQIGATVTGEIVLSDGVTAATAMKFAAETTKGSGTEGSKDYVAPATSKSAFVKFELAKAGADALDSGDVDDGKVVDVAAKEATWADAKSVVVSTKAVTEEDFITIGKAEVDEDSAYDGDNANNIVLYRLTGDCVVSPKTAWTEKDTFKVTVAYTFTPVFSASTGEGE